MPKPLRIVSSIAVPLLLENVDTDLIIRVERLFGAVPREKLGDFAFETLRKSTARSGRHAFPLDDDRYRGAEILIAGANFGCGSAREGAVWALAGLGLRAMLAPSFGDIFVTNCYQNGMLPITLPRERIARLATLCEHGSAPSVVSINLETQTVTGPDGIIDSFAVPALRRRALLDGLEDIALTLTYADRIGDFRVADEAARPWAYPSAT